MRLCRVFILATLAISLNVLFSPNVALLLDPSEGWNDIDIMSMFDTPKNESSNCTSPACANSTASSSKGKTNNDGSASVKSAAALRQHDSSSLTSYMWHKGKPFNPLLDERPEKGQASLVIDAVSIGSQYNVPQMEGQASSWGTHWSMRYLFGTTEQDDADPTCHLNMTDSQFENMFDYCTMRKYRHNSDVPSPLKAIKWNFPKLKWITMWKKTKGWLCAQQRFAHAVGKIGRFYRREGLDNLPDFFFIQDDDTWFGMNKLISHLSLRNQTFPYVTAGCLVEWPVHIVNFSFPFGGFGLMMNRQSLHRLVKPIYCNRTAMDPHMERVCLQIKENLVNEAQAFEDGMSISDLMDRHAAMHPYMNYTEWADPGYCMIGDWVLGYYANYYELGSVESQFLDYIHIDRALGHIYRDTLRTCLNHNGKHCLQSKTQYTCHRLTPDEMLELHAIDAKKESGPVYLPPPG